MEKFFREVKRRLFFETRNTLDFPAHIHDDIELVFVKHGSGIAYSDGKKYILKENSFFLVFPNQVHYYERCQKGEYIILIVKPSELLGLDSMFSQGVPISALLYLEDDDGIINLLQTAKNEFSKFGRSIITDAYFTAILGKLLRLYEIGKNDFNNDTLSKILNYCKIHYKDNISLTAVADELHLSRSTISHIFSSKLSLNFCDYINSLRLADAVKLMKNKDYTITEISYLSGFTTIRTFNRAFLKRYGISPSEYKKTMS